MIQNKSRVTNGRWKDICVWIKIEYKSHIQRKNSFLKKELIKVAMRMKAYEKKNVINKCIRMLRINNGDYY